jgi:hypothetical protein
MLGKTSLISLAVAILLAGCNGASKPISQSETYAWSVDGVNGTQTNFVCKKIDIVIYASKKVGSNMNSTVVADKYCAKLPKPGA